MVNLGQFIASDSMICRVDPRIKIVSTVALSILTFTANWLEVYLISLFLMIVMRMAHLKFRQMLSAIKPLVLFAALFFFIASFLHRWYKTPVFASFTHSDHPGRALPGGFCRLAVYRSGVERCHPDDDDTAFRTDQRP